MNDHTVTVTDVITRTPSSVSVRMEKPAGFSYQPGQWARFTVDCDGEGIGKPLSFSSSPTEPFLEFTKRLTGSPFCQGIGGLEPGSHVTMYGPLGRMIYRENMEQPVFISGGIGITPVRSMLAYIRDQGINGPMHLVYANRSLEETAFKEEFDAMSSGGGLDVTYVLDDPPSGWDGATGFITVDLLRQVFPQPTGRTWFLCGPPAMVDCLLKDLAGLGADKDNIHYERLEGYEGLI